MGSIKSFLLFVINDKLVYETIKKGTVKVELKFLKIDNTNSHDESYVMFNVLTVLGDKIFFR